MPLSMSWPGTSLVRDALPTGPQPPAARPTIASNHARYAAMDRCLQRAGGAIRSDWFAAAACVTHPRRGLGVLDRGCGVLVASAEEAGFLRHVHHALARMNVAWFERLVAGREIPGCEGLRGAALDHALVGLEQRAFTRHAQAWFLARPARRAPVMARLNERLCRSRLFRRPLVEPRLGRALEQAAMLAGPLDLDDEAHRCAVGRALVDLIRAERTGRAPE
jgi:hypothetical protein